MDTWDVKQTLWHTWTVGVLDADLVKYEYRMLPWIGLIPVPKTSKHIYMLVTAVLKVHFD